MMTRCPDCSTAFLVSAAQIKVRAGTVRCGECAAVFNALDTLVDDATDMASETHGIREESEWYDAVPEIFATPIEESDAMAPQIPAETDAILDEILSEHASGNAAENRAAEKNAAAERDAALPPDINGALAELETQQTAIPDYLAGPPPISNIASPSKRWPWTLGIVMAAIALLLQAIYYYRIELSVLRPELKPLLQAACKPMGCEVPRPSQIDMLSIETSDLRPDPQQAGRLTLTATLRSKAPYAQEWPLLELTLTDVGDRKLVVKHFAARDYLGKDNSLNARLAGGFPPNGEIAVTLPLDIGNLAAAGYRLYIFYP